MKLFRSLAFASLFVTSVFTVRAQFASSVVSYNPGTGTSSGFTTDATVALGAPSQVDPFGEPTDPFDPPYGTNQIVSIGAGGSLTLKFSSPIVHSAANKFGRDFVIFGNTGFQITNDFDLETFEFVGAPATDGSLFADNTGGLTRVWVSADGTNYFLLNTNLAPTVDTLYPPIGTGNPSIPVNPALTADDFGGQTLDGIAALYNGSAGGAGYDISWAQDINGNPVSLNAISYVRIEVVSGKSEIDAVAAVPPLISAQPISRSIINAGSNVVFTVAAVSTSPVTYQWFYDGAAINGQTNASLTLSNALTTANAGNYSVTVSSDSGSVTSTVATLNKPVPTGIYSGLFFETNAVKHDTSGFFTFTVAKTRKFSGSVRISGANLKLSGIFSSNHQATVLVPRTTGGDLTVSLQLLTVSNADQVIGTVGNGIWLAPLAGDRAVFNNTNNPAPQAGQYTFTLFTDSNGDHAPSNGSMGIANVKTNGVISVHGPLADQSAMVQSTYLSKDGHWPLYLPLYKGAGSVLGWVAFTNEPALKLTGTVSWIKTGPSGLYYAAGFTNTLTVYGGSRVK